MALAFRWGGGTLPADLDRETLRRLHMMWKLCDHRDEEERKARRG